MYYFSLYLERSWTGSSVWRCQIRWHNSTRNTSVLSGAAHRRDGGKLTPLDIRGAGKRCFYETGRYRNNCSFKFRGRSQRTRMRSLVSFWLSGLGKVSFVYSLHLKRERDICLPWKLQALLWAGWGAMTFVQIEITVSIWHLSDGTV